ncbi:MAG: aldo/keto reductase [Cypionkella sp.]
MNLTASDGRTFEACKLGFGGAAIGLTNYMGLYDARSPESRAAALETVRAAAANGINYFDTAPGYGDGLSEELMGEALETVTTPYFLASKVKLASADAMRASIMQSLGRLRRDRIDLIQVHGSSYTAAEVTEILRPGGALDALRKMRDEGLFRLIGFSTEDNNDGSYALINSGGFDAIQMAYNFMLQHPYEPTRPFGSLFEAKKRNMMTVTMRTATSGIFQRWIQMVNPDNGFDYSRALVQFVLSNKLVDIALVGIRDKEIALSSAEIAKDIAGRIDVDALWERYQSA